jgi:hypothetical protein
MKKLHLLLVFILVTGQGIAQDSVTGIEIESITPSTAILFVKTSKVRKFVATVKELAADFPEEKEMKEILESIKSFRDKTGIDALDSNSLSEAGIDVERKMGLAFFESSGKSENIIIFLPVADEKKFPLKFVEILKEMNKEKPDLDIYPAITSYRNSRIYQVRKDIFYTLAGGYFLIAPTGEILKKAIDLQEKGAGGGSSLMGDRVYSGYKDLVDDEYSVNLFATREMVIKAFESTSAGAGNPGKGSVKHDREKRPPFLDAIEFGAAGLEYSSRRLKMSVSTSFNNKDQNINSALDVIKTGISRSGLYLPGAHYNFFLSFDPGNLKEVCSRPASACSFFIKGVSEMEKEYGISYSRDIVPNFTGGINVNIEKFNPGSGNERYLLFFPMNDERKTGSMISRMRKTLKRKQREKGKYGETRIGKRPAFWILDSRGKKRFYAFDRRGLYIGSGPDLLRWGMKTERIQNSGVRSIYTDKIGPRVFFLLHLKKESFLSGMMKMRAARNKDLKNSVNRMGDFYLRGTKNGSFLSFDLDIEIMGPQ